MKIKVRLNGILNSRFGWHEQEFDLPTETTVAGLMQNLEEATEDFKFESIRSNIAINKQIVNDATVKLTDGDEVSFLPPLAGG